MVLSDMHMTASLFVCPERLRSDVSKRVSERGDRGTNKTVATSPRDTQKKRSARRPGPRQRTDVTATSAWPRPKKKDFEGDAEPHNTT